MRRKLIILAFLYFSIDSIFFLAKSGWPFTLPQWILVFMVIGMIAYAVYQWKIMVKEEKEKKEAEEEEESQKQLEAELNGTAEETVEDMIEDEDAVEDDGTSDSGSKYDE